jgi:hypothetical protein
VQEIKSALESTGDPVHVPGTTTEIAVTREGGGRIDLARADGPLIFTKPTGLSFGLVGVGTALTRTLEVDDAGGGPAPWTVTVQAQTTPSGVVLAPATPTVVPGSSVDIDLSVAPTAAEGDATGFVVLTRGTDVRHVPYWFRVESPKLGTESARTITHAGVYDGNTSGKPSLVSSYRYPEGSPGLAIPTELGGPEQVFRFRLTRTVANFGVVVLSHAKGVRVSPRLVAAGDENRVLGNAGLPVDLNPYSNFGQPEPVVGAILPTTGVYDFVFDTPTGSRPGAFTFRFWMNDTTPPKAKLLTHTVTPTEPLKVSIGDSGAGVDPISIAISVDGVLADSHYKHGILTLPPERLARGTHRLRLSVADYQETKNMEDVLNGATPNTRVYATTFTVR